MNNILLFFEVPGNQFHKAALLDPLPDYRGGIVVRHQ
jgi:hypothetical protein